MLKKCWILILMSLLLTGCAAVPTFETLGNISHESATEPVRAVVQLQLPEDAAQNTFQGENQTMYVCEDYTISLQTFASGDLKETLRSVTGYDPTRLTVLESTSGEAVRYDLIWTAVSDGGDLLCRGAVLDDGNYHYTLCVMGPASETGSLAEEWNALFGSFHLEK